MATNSWCIKLFCVQIGIRWCFQLICIKYILFFACRVLLVMFMLIIVFTVQVILCSVATQTAVAERDHYLNGKWYPSHMHDNYIYFMVAGTSIHYIMKDNFNSLYGSVIPCNANYGIYRHKPYFTLLLIVSVSVSI